jgi:hypothetical protein
VPGGASHQRSAFAAKHINRHERQHEQAEEVYSRYQMKRRIGIAAPRRHAELSELAIIETDATNTSHRRLTPAKVQKYALDETVQECEPQLAIFPKLRHASPPTTSDTR